LKAGAGPAYEQIARALVSDICSEKLRAGDLLPPHRDLAYGLGVSVGTITRAYQEASRSGLLATDGRRGTRVRCEKQAASGAEPAVARDLDLRSHASPLGNWSTHLRQAMARASLESHVQDLLSYEAGPGSRQLRQAGARWLEHVSGVAKEPDNLILTNGAQHALLCSLLSCCRTGDPIAVERLTHAGLKATAATLGLTLVPIEMDDFGLCPESLDRTCRSNPVKVLVTVPDIHNPTTKIQPASRRQQIAKVAEKHRLTVIEDAVYAGLAPTIQPAIASFLPEQVIRLVGLSKTLGPGLRVGFIEAPNRMLDRLAANVKGTTWMTSPIQAEIARDLIESGAAQDILIENRTELSQRRELVLQRLSKFNVRVSEGSPHAWLELPAPWTSESFVSWAQRTGFLILSADGFTAERDRVDHAVRISVSASPDEEQLDRALALMEQALLHPFGLADTPF